MNSKDPDTRECMRQQALDDLARLRREGDGISHMAGLARVKDHFSASDAANEDAAEIWGRRIGRILSAVVAIGLIIHLVRTYG